MAKTLVLKGTNFSVNKLATVELENSVDCTGISLNKSSTNVSYGNTETLVATVTPANTTDVIEWSTSDNTVATVFNGAVTSVGIGTATITATCGNYSASCTVTVTGQLDKTTALRRVGYYLATNAAADGNNGLTDWSIANSSRGGFASGTGALPLRNPSTVYPYVLPNNTGRIRITLASGTSIVAVQRILWYNHTTVASNGVSVKEIGNTSQDSVVFTTDGSGNKVATVNVPSYEGFPDIDSFVINLQMASGGTFTEAMLNDVTVEFLLAE